MKNLVESKCREILKSNEKSIDELSEKIMNGGNKKSLESVICGIKRNNSILNFIINLINDNYSLESLEIIKRLGYNRKVELKEVSKEDVIKDDLIDKVVIKKVNGVNKYFVEV